MAKNRRCEFAYSTGHGTGVAECLGNWGFSNEVASPGHELKRMKCLLSRMEALKTNSSSQRVATSRKKICAFGHSSPDSRPCWVTGKSTPMITYTSVLTTHKSSDKKNVMESKIIETSERRVCYQRSDKWYKMGPLCCPQPSCPVPYCSPEPTYCCLSYCV